VSDLTYAEIGATQHEPLPDGYYHVRYRTFIGRGEEVFRRAGQAIVSFDMHRRSGARVHTDAAQAAPGVRLTVGLGPFTVPCEVVWVADGAGRAGFGYGTLPGHIESGEEAFQVERDSFDRVWFSVTAFSRPARWPAKLGGPVARLAQHGYARLLGRALRRISSGSRTVGS
jgi:uncharacterized protein (UPF0548 family)